MKGAIEFVQTTALGGLLVVLPILILTLLLSEALDLVAAISEPIAAALPVEEVGGVEIALLLGILIILLLCFLTGLIAPEDVAAQIDGFDMVLHASRWEGLPRAIVQGLQIIDASTAIPEPSTLVLGCLGLVGLGLFSRRRRRVSRNELSRLV